MEQLIYERLRGNLMKLKLGHIHETLDTLIVAAEKENLSSIALLDRLFEEEVAAKDKRRIDMAMRMAGLPSGNTIEEYDFTFHPHLDKKTVMELFDLTFLGPP